MDENAEMLRLATGTGIIHHFVGEECSVQGGEREREQCEVEWEYSSGRSLPRRRRDKLLTTNTFDCGACGLG
jgi:hypothetical protein